MISIPDRTPTMATLETVHVDAIAGPKLSWDSRETHDRLRAAWITTGWDWDDTRVALLTTARHGAIWNLLLASALLVEPATPSPDELVIVGEVSYGGGVYGGVVADGRTALRVRSLPELPPALASVGVTLRDGVL